MLKTLTGSSFNLEKKYISRGYDFIVGIDEAGRGPLAGPVVACACTHKRNLELVNGNLDKKNPNYQLLFTNYSKIRDSKTLSEKQRESIYDFICENFYVGIGLCDHKTVDRVNILQATFLAMKKSLSDLSRQTPHPLTPSPARGRGWIERKRNPGEGKKEKYIILIDGNKTIPNLSIEQKAITNGDKIVKTISAASIIAKVTRDRIMRRAHQKFPKYCFDRHKGYGTKIHMGALKKYGPCEIHRRSFRLI